MNESAEKVKVLLASDQPFEVETLWANPVGNDLYQLDNIPFFAYDLHCGDTVYAIASQPGDLPSIMKVIQRSGHRTLRVIFSVGAADGHEKTILDWLNSVQVDYEGFGPVVYDGRLFALDVRPEADYQAVCDRLYTWEQEGLLVYETGTMNATDG